MKLRNLNSFDSLPILYPVQVGTADRDVRAGGDDPVGPDDAGAGQGVQGRTRLDLLASEFVILSQILSNFNA